MLIVYLVSRYTAVSHTDTWYILPGMASGLPVIVPRLIGDLEEQRHLGAEARQRVEADSHLDRAIEPLWERFCNVR